MCNDLHIMHILISFVTVYNNPIVIRMSYHSFETLLLLSLFNVKIR